MEKINPNSLSIIYTEQLYSLSQELTTSNTTSVTDDNKASEPVISAQPVEKIKVAGSGANNILIINNDSKEAYISTNDKLFLSKVIESTNNKLEECSFVNIRDIKPTLAALITQTNATKIITFGVNLFELELRDKIPVKYELSNIGDNISIITADSLKEISLNKEKKTAFWFALKRMFTI